MLQNDYVDFFNKNGYVVLPKAISDDLIDSYVSLWESVNADRPEGWSKLKTFTRSFNDHVEILDILCAKSIYEFFESINKDPVLHADITYSVSTQLDWHQDNTSSIKESMDSYYGSWVALEDIDPKSGPLAVMPGSHLWDMDYSFIDPSNCVAEDYVSFNKKRLEYYTEEIEKRNTEEVSFIANKGDVLIWHGRLLHKGSTPRDYSMTRMSLIGHYSEYSGSKSRHESGILYALN
jgi:ectoine hydroxylase-related dioxygenase (phytanoyl-CoA dioxygenase family)